MVPDLEYQSYFTVDGTWIYEVEPQRSVTNKQWLRINQARPAM